MKAIAKIKDASTEWDEKFEVSSVETAEEEIKEVINYYNETLQGNDILREFVKIISIK